MDSADIVHNLCRICFELHENVLSLYNNNDGSSPFEKLMNNTKLELGADDGGPNSICLKCNEELNLLIKFLEKCNRANILLLQHKQNHQDVFENNNDCSNEDQGKQHENSWSNQLNSNEIKSNRIAEENVSFIKNRDGLSVKHICHYCSKTFTRKFNLKLHLKRHSGEVIQPQRPVKRRVCPIPACGRSFTSSTNLSTHIRTHNGERPYECTECGKTFRSSSTLNDHKRIHTGVKPYMCPTCGKRFTTNKLSAHMRSHGARAHACASCPRRFSSARAAALHARAHSPPARAHACTLCAARYNHSQSLNKHMRKRHGVKTSSANTSQQVNFA